MPGFYACVWFKPERSSPKRKTPDSTAGTATADTGDAGIYYYIEKIGHDNNTPEHETKSTTESDKTAMVCQQKNENLRRAQDPLNIP